MGGRQEDFDFFLGRATTEIQNLIGDKARLNARDIYRLRDFARQRTDLGKSPHCLSGEERAWKHIYGQLDRLLERLIGRRDKARMQRLEQQLQDAAAGPVSAPEGGGDSLKGKLVLLIFLLFGFAGAIDGATTLVYPFAAAGTGLIAGLLFASLVLKNAWARSLLARFLLRAGRVFQLRSLITCAENLNSTPLGMNCRN